MSTSTPTSAAPGRSRPRRGSRVALWLGLAMIAAGAGLLGYVGWQLYGTTWVSEREQQRIAGDLQTRWDRDAATATGGDPAPGRRLQPAQVPEGEASALVRIPRFGADYVVPVLEGTTVPVLEKGFGHFSDTADPGEVGNYALAAHRVTHGEPLRRMPELRPGDEVVIETVDTTYTYVLDTDPEDLVIPFTGVWVLDDVPTNPRAGGAQPAQEPGQRLITLTTCSEIFHTDDRMIAFGHLASAVPKAPA